MFSPVGMVRNSTAGFKTPLELGHLRNNTGCNLWPGRVMATRHLCRHTCILPPTLVRVYRQNHAIFAMCMDVLSIPDDHDIRMGDDSRNLSACVAGQP